MTAGESAREVARRSRQRNGRETAWSAAFERGADGEERTAAALTALPAAEWTVVHDVAWPGRDRANLDHVVVGPGGVFVIDAKAWSGHVTMTAGELRQDGRRRTRAVDGAVAQADCLRHLVRDLDPRLVVPVLCLVGQGPVSARLGEVLVVSPETLVPALTAVQRVLADDVRRRLAARLFRELPTAMTPPARRTRPPRLPRGHTLPPPGMTPRLPARPSRSPHRSTRTTRRRSGRTAAVGLALALVALAALLLAARAGLVRSAVEAVLHHAYGDQVGSAVPAEAGEQLAVPGAGRIPDLDVRVLDVVPVAPRSGPPPRGSRLWAAYVVVRNAGGQPHRPPASFVPDLVDGGGTSHAATDRLTRRGRSLASGKVLRPGATAQGYVVWALPRDERPATVVLRGAVGTARWDAGRAD